MTFSKTATLITGNINQSQSIQQSVTLQPCSTKTTRGPGLFCRAGERYGSIFYVTVSP